MEERSLLTTITQPIMGDDRVGLAEYTAVALQGAEAGSRQPLTVTFQDRLGAVVTASTTANEEGAWVVAAADLSALDDGLLTVIARSARGDEASATVTKDTCPPVAASVTASPETVADVTTDLTLTIAYGEAMDPAANPAISFPTTGENPLAAPPAFVFGGGTWSDDQTYIATYAAVEQDLSLPTIDVRVEGAKDRAGNAQLAVTVADKFSIDTQNPTIAVETPGAFTGASTINFTIRFSEPVSGFTEADVTVSGTAGASSAAIANPANDAQTYNVAVGSMTARGTVTITVAAAAAMDAAGNLGPPTAVAATMTYDQPPAVTQAIPDQTFAGPGVKGFQFAADTFTDPDVADTLSYSAALSSGERLPDWLIFSAGDRTFNGNPGPMDFTPLRICVTARDGYGASASTEFDLRLDHVNDAPTLTPSEPELGTLNQDLIATWQSSTLASGITDEDHGTEVGGLAITATSGNGDWAYSLDETSFVPIRAVSESLALLLPGGARLRYVPDGTGGETARISYRAWDTTSGAPGATVDLTGSEATGGGTAFSTATDTAVLTVLPQSGTASAVLSAATFGSVGDAEQISSLAKQGRLADELVLVDSGRAYELTGWARSGDGHGQLYNPANAQYFGFACYDIDRQFIQPWQVLKVAGAADTVLAADLAPGAMQVVLQDGSGWYANDESHMRSLAWYGYQDSTGYTYPDYTYTRHVLLDAWDANQIDGNIVTLRSPWTGPQLKAGTAVRNAQSGGTYNYAAVAGQAVPDHWTRYTVTISGTQQDGGGAASEFRPGTAYIKPLLLLNYHGQTDNLVTWRDVTWAYAGLPTYAAGQTVRLHVAGLPSAADAPSYHWRQIGGPTVTLQNADSRTATLVVPHVLPNGSLSFAVDVTQGDVTLQGSVSISYTLELSAAVVLKTTTFRSAGGTEQLSSLAMGGAFGDELVPVDVDRAYQLSGWARSGDGQGQLYNPANMQYFGFACYDIDQQLIQPWQVLKVAGAADTVLAADLTPGATQVVLQDGSGWYAGSVSHARSLAWYGYRDSTGYTYPDYTYTRHVLLDAWDADQIAGNVIRLRSPWTGPELKAGTAVRNARSGGTYNYAVLSGAAVSDQWTQYAVTIRGVQQEGTGGERRFRPGTAYIKPLLLLNCHGQADNQVTWRDVLWSHTGMATYQAGQTVDLHVAAVESAESEARYQWRQIGGPTVTLQNADSRTATLVVPRVLPNGSLSFAVDVTQGDVTLQGSASISYTLDLSAAAVLDATTFRSAGGTEQLSSLAMGGAFGDELVPVDVDRAYQLSGWARSGDGYGQLYNPNNVQYFGFACYDIDQQLIQPWQVLKVAGATDTVLAADLAPGATQVVLQDGSGWYTGSVSHARSLAWYGYQDSTGDTYPDYTYTRHVLLDAWDAGQIAGNVIRLRSPWTGPELKAGTAVRNARSGGTYNYAVLSGAAVSDQWTQYAVTIRGVQQEGIGGEQRFRPGTAYIKPLLLLNCHGQADNQVTWRDVTWAYAGVPTYEAGQTVQLHVAEVESAAGAPRYHWRQTGGPAVTLQDEDSRTATLVVPSVLSDSPLSFAVDVTQGDLTLQASVSISYTLDLSAAVVLDATTFGSAGGDKQLSSLTMGGAFGDDFVSVDVNQAYQLSGWARSGDGHGQFYNPANVQYFGFACYDIDQQLIQPWQVLKVAGAADTVLAADLTPGATQVVLQDGSGWYAGSVSHARSLAWYGYRDSTGYTYPDYTYTRHVLLDAWGADQISGNIITLRTPWTGPQLKAGTAVRNAQSSWTYNYAALSAQAVPEQWTWYAATISGVQQDGAGEVTGFRPGTAYIKPLLLFNHHGQADNLVTWRDVVCTATPALAAVLDATTFFSAGGSERISSQADQEVWGDDFVRVDVNQVYQLSGWARSGDAQGQFYDPANQQSFGLAAYDLDRNLIEPVDVFKVSGAQDTVLAADLTPGATQVVLQDARGWYAGGEPELRSLAWYGYQDSTGYTYPDYTYTRNVLVNAWDGKHIQNNVITLRSPWTGPLLKAGTAVRNATAGDVYHYAALAGGTVPNRWTQYAATISGVVENGVPKAGTFWPGTAYIKPVLGLNGDGQGLNLVSWRNVRWTYAAASLMQRGDVVDLQVGEVTAPDGVLNYAWSQTFGPAVTLPQANSRTTRFVIPDDLPNQPLVFAVVVRCGDLMLRQTVTVPLTPVNHAPAGTDQSVRTLAGTAYTFGLSDFGFTDPEDSLPNGFAGVRVTTLPEAGTLEVNGTAVAAGDFVAAVDLTAGKLAFVPAAGGYGSPSASFTFQVQDDGGTGNGGRDLDPTPNRLSISVTTDKESNQFSQVLEPARAVWTAGAGGWSATGLQDGWSYLLSSGNAPDNTRMECDFTVEHATPPGWSSQSWAYADYRAGREDSGYDLAAIVRYTDAEHFYRVQLSFAGQEVAIWKPSGGFVQVGSVALEPGRPHHLAVEARGPWLEVFLDGTSVLRWCDRFEPVTCGASGVGVYHSAVRFGQLQVSALADTVPPTESPSPQFHWRSWRGGDWIFDGNEPVARFDTGNMTLFDVKLAPGIRPVLCWEPFWKQYDPDGLNWSNLLDRLEILAQDGTELRLRWQSHDPGQRITTSATMTVCFDAGRGCYVYDVQTQFVVNPGQTWQDTVDGLEYADLFPYNVVGPPTAGQLVTWPWDYQWVAYTQPDGTLGRYPISHNDQVLVSPKADGGLYGYFGTNPINPVVLFENVADPAWHAYAGICNWAHDVHLRYRPNPTGYVMPAGTTYAAHYQVVGFGPDASAETLAAAQLHAFFAEPDQYPIYVSGRNTFEEARYRGEPQAEYRWQGGEWDRNEGHDDLYSLRLSGEQAGLNRSTIDVGGTFFMEPLAAGTYTFTAWVKTQEVGGNGATLGLQPLSPDQTPLYCSQRLTGTGDWQPLQWTVTLPKLNAVRLILQLDGSGIAWFDDVAFILG